MERLLHWKVIKRSWYQTSLDGIIQCSLFKEKLLDPTGNGQYVILCSYIKADSKWLIKLSLSIWCSVGNGPAENRPVDHANTGVAQGVIGLFPCIPSCLGMQYPCTNSNLCLNFVANAISLSSVTERELLRISLRGSCIELLWLENPAPMVRLRY